MEVKEAKQTAKLSKPKYEELPEIPDYERPELEKFEKPTFTQTPKKVKEKVSGYTHTFLIMKLKFFMKMYFVDISEVPFSEIGF